MINEASLEFIRASIEGEVAENPLEGMNEADLRRLRGEVDKLLPPDTLDSLNIEAELVGQYRKAKLLYDDVVDDKDIPANQKAQCANSVVATLGQLIKLQEDLQREQSFKLMEECLVEALKAVPESVRDAFYAEYERLATKAGLA